MTDAAASPRTPPGRSPARATGNPRPTVSGPPVALVLEDNQGDALLLDELLADAGLVMHHATRLADAIGALRAQVFDFVMCDLNLPDGAGLDVVRQLQALAGDAPLIVLTSVDDDDLAARAVQAGAQDYLVKGQVTSATLRRTLRHSRERKQLFQQLFAMTHRDALTGAVNRVGLRAQLEVAIDRSRDGDPRFAVMYLDLDHFKAINDTLGHDAGDAVLREVVVRLDNVVRKHDVIARLGGDEFAIFLDGFACHAGVIDVADRVLRALEVPIMVAGAPLGVTASIGIACHPDSATSVDGLLQAADGAMYQAKRRGRNIAVLAGNAPDEQRARGALALELQLALERREFVLHFQPQIELAQGRLVGFEALLRWQRPGVGLVSPAEFIPILEDSGRMVAVGEWVIERAVEQVAAWRAAGHGPLRVAVNLSTRQFERPGLVDWARGCLRRFDVPATALELEITESNLMTNPRETSATLAELRDLGVRVSIDDFGTGYSSLSYLNQFEVDCLKIDRSLVAQVEARGDGAAITSAIISLGHHLGLDVVAEGVETAAQLAELQDADCDLVQGYLLGRPVATPAFPAAAGLDARVAALARMRATVPIRLQRVRG